MPETFTPTAIPTEYRGQKFRSRLESTVAWLLDAMGVEWQYEPQSFLLPNNVNYWPDFYCPKQKMWIEAAPKG